MNRRIGRFEVAAYWFDQEEAPNILDGCLVLNVEHDYAREVITYTAIHSAFRVLDQGEAAPMYVGIFAYGRRSPWWRMA
jgi:hypothetical protein